MTNTNWDALEREQSKFIADMLKEYDEGYEIEDFVCEFCGDPCDLDKLFDSDGHAICSKCIEEFGGID